LDTARETSPEALTAASWERTIAALEATGDYRVLRHLQPRLDRELTTSSATRLGIFLDTETTGTDHTTDEIIELAMVPFTYSLDGRILAVGAPFSGLREPSVPILPEITALTGITHEMVAGHQIDAATVERFVAPAALLIAHHAGFDRPFTERAWPIFATKPWACSMSQIPWHEEGFDGLKLRYLALLSGFFYDAHRAAADCAAAIELLSRPLPRSKRRALAVLLETARQPIFRLWAENAPFAHKDVLKKRGYRWSADTGCPPRCWYIDVAKHQLAAERAFLLENVLGPTAEPPVEQLTAFTRFSAGSG
jgi:DNA polymerase-3 subunit epsilon